MKTDLKLKFSKFSGIYNIYNVAKIKEICRVFVTELPHLQFSNCLYRDFGFTRIRFAARNIKICHN